MEEINLINNVATLTTIPEKYLYKLVEKSLYAISDAVAQSQIAESKITDIDIGIGTLSIKIAANLIEYHFTPSETVVVDKVTNVYKDIL